MAHLDFPNAPSTGQKYPASPISGIPTYTWDGEKWTTLGGPVAGKTPIYADGSNAMTAQLTLVAPPVAGTDAAAKSYVDAGDTALNASVANCLQKTGGQTITGGFAVTPYHQAGGNFTVNPLNGNYQWITNNGALTITAPTTDCAVDILVSNGTGAGAITFAGFTVGSNVGDVLTTTVGSYFIISIRRINGISTYVVKALQ
jgi:hypothetical protein